MRCSNRLIATFFAIMAAGTSAVAASAKVRGSAETGDLVEITDLQPFTHVAYIPMGAGLSSIKIESVKLVKVATKRRTIIDERYCNRPWAEPGGSVYCLHSIDESTVPAYRVTYSYSGQPMTSDEYGNTYFTFSVYFRPDEINPRVREILAFGRIVRGALEELFQLTTSREPAQQTVIDPENSALCDGNYVDGNWIGANPECVNRIVYQEIAAVSPQIRVRVDPVSSRAETAALAPESWRR